jgi:hypothetical protein
MADDTLEPKAGLGRNIFALNDLASSGVPFAGAEIWPDIVSNTRAALTISIHHSAPAGYDPKRRRDKNAGSSGLWKIGK